MSGRGLAGIVFASVLLFGSGCGAPVDSDSDSNSDGETSEATARSGDSLVQIMTPSERRWRDDVKLDISYCVDAGFGADRSKVAQAVASATADWSRDVQIAFRYVSSISTGCWSSTAVRLRVIPGMSYACSEADGSTSYSYEPRTCADGSTPGMVPNQGGMDPAAQTGAVSFVYETVKAAAAELKRVALHELGHVLGFDHEDGALGCSSNHTVGGRPLTGPDPDSIMVTCRPDRNMVLSALDRRGAGLLYGHVEPQTVSFPPTPLAAGSGFSAVLAVATGANSPLKASISGRGNLDLYVGLGFFPDPARFSAASEGTGANEVISVDVPKHAFGQDVFVHVYARSAGTLDSFAVTHDNLTNPLPLLPRIGNEIATFNPARAAPTCARASLGCDSGATLVGRGSMRGGAELNAPNHPETTCNDGSSGSYGSYQSIEAIRVKSTDSGPLRPLAFVNVEVDVNTRYITTDRLDVYYRAHPDDDWRSVGSSYASDYGVTTLTFPLQLVYGGPLQAIRAVHRYRPTGSPSPCPSNLSKYDDIDDLGFTVAPIYAGYEFD